MRAAAELAAVEPGALPAALAAESVPALTHAVTSADSALAVVTRRVESSGVWAEAGARSAVAWVTRVSGVSSREATARLNAARAVEERQSFAAGLHSGSTSVARLDAVRRTLWGPGLVKAERRRCLPAFAESLAAAATTSDSATFVRILREWTEVVDHAPTGPEADAITHRYLTFTERGDTCLLEASMPLPEGRLLRRRLEAAVDSHYRSPAGSRVEQQATPLGRGDEQLREAAGDELVPRSAFLLDAFLLLADVADAHDGAVPIVDGTPPQVLVIVSEQRLRRRCRTSPTGTTAPSTITDPSPPAGTPSDEPTAGVVPPALLWSGSGPVSVSEATARWASCGDAEIRRLVLDTDDIVTDLGRSARIADRNLRLAGCPARPLVPSPRLPGSRHAVSAPSPDALGGRRAYPARGDVLLLPRSSPA